MIEKEIDITSMTEEEFNILLLEMWNGYLAKLKNDIKILKEEKIILEHLLENNVELIYIYEYSYDEYDPEHIYEIIYNDTESSKIHELRMFCDYTDIQIDIPRPYIFENINDAIDDDFNKINNTKEFTINFVRDFIKHCLEPTINEIEMTLEEYCN